MGSCKAWSRSSPARARASAAPPRWRSREGACVVVADINAASAEETSRPIAPRAASRAVRGRRHDARPGRAHGPDGDRSLRAARRAVQQCRPAPVVHALRRLDRRAVRPHLRRQREGRVLRLSRGDSAHESAGRRGDPEHRQHGRHPSAARPGGLQRVQGGGHQPDQDAGASSWRRIGFGSSRSARWRPIRRCCPASSASSRAPTKPRAQRFIATIPWGRLNRPEDLARAAVFLASADAEMVTGTAFEVDGGRDV